ncbi:MarR family winged helix-turn-helix transcriptional regulator [Streptomyces shenzhenensis]|uniref:MarR family winged helix-turn-helix transcriptional regulator n=1 Tax=Streptomyces shenzhenensis TaxID=943815 RepID=UPI0033E4BC84
MDRPSGAQLAQLLLVGFHSMADEVIAELANRGHADVRPLHEFALRAIDAGADTASELGRRLSVSKQAAAKTIAALEQLGYVDKETDPHDARRKPVRVTPRGRDMMAIGETLFDQVRDRWAGLIGDRQLDALAAHLTRITGSRHMSADDLARFPADPDENNRTATKTRHQP